MNYPAKEKMYMWDTERKQSGSELFSFVQVGGALLGFAVERISVGMQHVAAQARPLDKKTGLPQLGSEFSGLFMWGRGREGQLGVATYQDNSVPKMVDELKGRRVLQVPPIAP